jgi:dTDP-6-deoxy-L-talose 4-dehydrogenase (NAD+)
MLTLITGSTGFLGKYFTELIEDSSEIIYLTRDRTKFRSDKKIIEGDLSDEHTLLEIKEYGFERLIHFAWEGLPHKDKLKNTKNFDITKNLVDNLLESNPLCELNFMGSCLEIESNKENKDLEIVNNNNSHFAKIKNDLLTYIDEKTLNYRWFRIFYAYGFGQHENSLVNSIYNSLKNGDTPVLKDINTLHDYIFVEDVVNLIYSFIYSTDCKNIIEIGTGSATSNFEILATIAKHFDVSVNQSREIESKTLCADLELVNKHFPKFTFHSIEAGIDKIITQKHL